MSKEPQILRVLARLAIAAALFLCAVATSQAQQQAGGVTGYQPGGDVQSTAPTIAEGTKDAPHATAKILSGIQEIRPAAAQMRDMIFLPLAFVMLVGSLMSRFAQAETPKQMLEAVISPAIAAIFCLGSAWCVSTVSYLGDAAAEQAVSSAKFDYRNIGTAFADYAHLFVKVDPKVVAAEKEASVNAQRQAQGAPPNAATAPAAKGGIAGFFNSVFGSVGTAVHGVKQAVSGEGFYGIVRYFINMVICAVIGIFAILAGCLIDCFLIARFFLLVISSIFLPVFIAGLVTGYFRTQAFNYIFGIIGIACWPVAWAVGHLGTRALFEWVVDYTNSLLTLGGTSMKFGATATVWKLGGTSVWATAAVINPLVLFVLFFAVIVLVIYATLVTIAGPILIGRMVASGSQFASGLVGGAAIGTAALAGAGLKAAGVVASTATGGGAAVAAAGGSSPVGGSPGTGDSSGGEGLAPSPSPAPAPSTSSGSTSSPSSSMLARMMSGGSGGGEVMGAMLGGAGRLVENLAHAAENPTAMGRAVGGAYDDRAHMQKRSERARRTV